VRHDGVRSGAAVGRRPPLRGGRVRATRTATGTGQGPVTRRSVRGPGPVRGPPAVVRSRCGTAAGRTAAPGVLAATAQDHRRPVRRQRDAGGAAPPAAGTLPGTPGRSPTGAASTDRAGTPAGRWVAVGSVMVVVGGQARVAGGAGVQWWPGRSVRRPPGRSRPPRSPARVWVWVTVCGSSGAAGCAAVTGAGPGRLPRPAADASFADPVCVTAAQSLCVVLVPVEFSNEF
jgi:hypothetical protein